MKLFGRKDSARVPARAGQDGSDGKPPVSHRLTLELKRAETFAHMLAHSRASQVVEVADLLAGMYICNWDRLSQYWDERGREKVESVLRGICQISPQRWHSWIELYDRQRREGEPQGWHLLSRLKKKERAAPQSGGPGAPQAGGLMPSAALVTLLEQAEKIAPSYDRTSKRSIPILTSECVLLCIVRTPGSEVSRKLAATGLDAARLEKAALLPRRPPRA